MDAGVFVLGMHRSGTSAVTRVISLLGLEPPHQEDLLTPRAENPKGYWESASLVAFNERILKTLGSDTGCPVGLDPGWENDPRLDPLRDPARHLIADVFPKPPWVFKDPRLSLTFGFWRAVLSVRPVVVVVSRNPLEILVSRLGDEREDERIYLLAVWERYLRRALAQIVGLPVFVTTYTALLGAPLPWCEQMASFLTGAGVDAARRLESDTVQSEVLRFVDRGLRHSEFARADFLAHRDVSDAQGQLLCALEDLEGPHESFVAPALPEETPTTSALLRERRHTLKVRQELRGLLEAERRRHWHWRLRNSRYGDAARPIYATLRRLRHRGSSWMTRVIRSTTSAAFSAASADETRPAGVPVYTQRVDIRSMLRRLFGQSSDGPEPPAALDRGDLGEPKSVEETLDDVKEDQAPETGRGLP